MFQNGRSYYGLDGAMIAVPQRELWRPKRELLEWHREKVYWGWSGVRGLATDPE